MVKYTFSNVGNTFSAKSISDYLKAEHRKIDNENVYSYLEKLEKDEVGGIEISADLSSIERRVSALCAVAK